MQILLDCQNFRTHVISLHFGILWGQWPNCQKICVFDPLHRTTVSLNGVFLYYCNNIWMFFWMQRNYRFFFMFVSTTTLLFLYVFGICWVFIVRIRDRENISIRKAINSYPASIVLIIYAFLALLFVGGLTAYHLYLISKNMVKITPLNLWNLWPATCGHFFYLKKSFSCFKHMNI